LPPSVRVTVAGMVLLLALIPAGCMVLDALAPTGPRGVVTFTSLGATTLSVGPPVPVAIAVFADGVPLPPQRLRLGISPDSTRVTLNVTADSLIPCQAGQAALLVQLFHSSASGTGIPDTSIDLHVTGGGTPDPRCPP